jgi:hypothetical protein
MVVLDGPADGHARPCVDAGFRARLQTDERHPLIERCFEEESHTLHARAVSVRSRPTAWEEDRRATRALAITRVTPVTEVSHVTEVTIHERADSGCVLLCAHTQGVVLCGGEGQIVVPDPIAPADHGPREGADPFVIRAAAWRYARSGIHCVRWKRVPVLGAQRTITRSS